jgi:glutathione S-transferase
MAESTEFKLYCFAQSGNAYKVALMLNLCEAKWEPRFVDFFNGETRTPEFRGSINEMGEVPVLTTWTSTAARSSTAPRASPGRASASSS